MPATTRFLRFGFLPLALMVPACSGPQQGGEPKPPTIDTPAETTQMTTAEIIDKAIAATSRPADDVARDEGRKPAEILTFFGIEPGMTVADLMTGRGYYADLLSRVVGLRGTVYAHNSDFVVKRFADKPLTERLANPELKNVVRWDRELDDLQFEPGSLDVAMMVIFYHDTIWQKVDRAKMNREIFAALKPGGVFGVVDHVAADGAGDVSKTLHRIEPQQIISEVVAAGFVLEEESSILRNKEDDHTRNVFDDDMRGKSDRVTYRFRKPR